MVILGFMFNYMLRVNLAMAITDMIQINETSVARNSTDSVKVEGVKRYHWDTYAKNDILGYFFWGYILTEIPGGRLAEIIGARRVFGGGMLAASLLTILTPVICDLPIQAILFSRVLMGFFLGATWPAIPPMAAKWIPPLERSKFIANMMASSLGAALTMTVSGLLTERFGWPSVFYCTGVVGMIWSISWFFLVFDSPAEHPRITAQERCEIETAIAVASGNSVKPTRVPWLAILTSAPVWAIIIVHTCSIFGYFTVVNQLPTYMMEVLHFDAKNNGFLSSIPYLGKYAMAVAASWLADRLRRSGKLSTTATRKIFTLFAVLIPGGLMVLEALWGYNAPLSVTIFTCQLFFNGAVTAGYLANGLDIAPNFSGTIFGLANTFSSMSGFISTKIVALLTKNNHTFDQWRYIFWLLAIVYCVGAVAYLILGSGNLQPWNSAQQKLTGNGEKMQEMEPLKGKEPEIKA
ncbi:sialin isoform X2 [Agrilus planipennis]|nr:sialin isoform X2 [Agrilus planipennis]